MSIKAEPMAYSYKELEHLYRVGHKTFKKWLKDNVPNVGPKSGRYFTVKQVETIFDKLGAPNIPGNNG